MSSDYEAGRATVEKRDVELRLTNVNHKRCGEYRIETYPEALSPGFCPGCGGALYG